MEKHQETFFGCDADYRDARIVKKAPSCMQHDDALIGSRIGVIKPPAMLVVSKNFF